MAAQTGRNQHGDLDTEVDQVLASLKAIGTPSTADEERKARLLNEVFNFIIGRDPTQSEIDAAA